MIPWGKPSSLPLASSGWTAFLEKSTIEKTPAIPTGFPARGMEGESWSLLLLILWAAGVIGFLAWSVARHRRLSRLVRRCGQEILSGPAWEELERAKNKMRIRRRVRLMECPGISSPMLMGWFSPRICIPCLDDAETEELYWIFRHELIHLRRGDPWIQILFLWVRCFHWWNPLVYVMLREAAAMGEISCDEAALQEAKTEERKRYGKILVKAASFRTGQTPAFPFFSVRRGLRRRLEALRETQKPKKRSWLACLALAGSLLSGWVWSYPVSAKGEAGERLELYRAQTAENFEPYQALGLAYHQETDELEYQGRRVQVFWDIQPIDKEYQKSWESSITHLVHCVYEDTGSSEGLLLKAERDEGGTVSAISPLNRTEAADYEKYGLSYVSNTSGHYGNTFYLRDYSKEMLPEEFSNIPRKGDFLQRFSTFYGEEGVLLLNGDTCVWRMEYSPGGLLKLDLLSEGSLEQTGYTALGYASLERIQEIQVTRNGETVTLSELFEKERDKR